jgi:hypothetical protein
MEVRRSTASEFIAGDMMGRGSSQALGGRRLRNRDSGCDEFDVPETSYPLKAKGGQPRIPA